MSTERLKQLAGALLALLLLWAVASLLRGGPDTGSADFAFPDVEPSAVSHIRIQDAATTVDLEMSTGGWLVNGYRAADPLVTGFLAALNNDSITSELASVSEASQSRMGVDAISGKTVTLFRGSEEAGSFVAGKRGPSFGTLYARMPDDSETYLVHANLLTHIQRSVDDWREHQLAAANPDSIGEIEISRSSGLLTLTRGDSTWTLGDGSPADSAAVARLIERYRSIRATGFAAESDTVDLDRPDMTIALRDRGGSPMLSLVFDSVASGYWVRPSNDSTVFRIANWGVNQLAPADSTLRQR